MATLLRERDLAQHAPRNDLAPLRTDWIYAAPRRYIFRELSMKLDGGLQLFYKDPVLAQPVPAGGIAEVVAGILNPSPWGPVVTAATASAVAQETPLDLNIHGDPAWVVLRLDPTLNWRFDSDEAAISLKAVEVSRFYGGLRHVLDDGTVRAGPTVGSRLVYFAARPPALAVNGSYRHGFNFHLELVQASASATSGDTILPIIIDPDVGHPGGSQS